MATRAQRRHHRERLKKKRRFLWGRDLKDDQKAQGVSVNTPTPCSCHFCGNPRKHFRKKTVQERKADEAENEAI